MGSNLVAVTYIWRKIWRQHQLRLQIFLWIWFYQFHVCLWLGSIQFLILSKCEARKRSEGKCRRTQIYFASTRLHDSVMYLYLKIYRKLIIFFAYQTFITEKYDNNQKLQPVSLLKSGVLQVIFSWKNQSVFQCLKY